MQFDIGQLGAQAFRVDHTLPVDFQGRRLPGASVLTAQHPVLGTIIQQECSNAQYSIRYHFFDVLEPFTLRGIQAAARLTSFLSVRSTLDYHIQGIGNVVLRQGQFALLHNEERPSMAHFFKTKPHEFMEISWMDEYLLSLLNPFRLLEKLFEPLSKHRHGFFLSPRPRPAGIFALDRISMMLRNPAEVEVARALFETQTKEFLVRLLIEARKKEMPRLLLTGKQRDQIITIGNRVLNTYDRDFSIAELAKEAGMNETTFRNGFKEIFGDALSRLHIAARMHEALRLLQQTNLNLKAIAPMVNYQFPTSLIKHFKLFFNYNPSDVLRKGEGDTNE